MKIINIEQGSDQWHVERWRSVGGTRIQSAIGAKYSVAKDRWTLGDKKTQRSLLLELVSENQSELEIDDYCNSAMQRGHDLEPISVRVASDRLGLKLESCGMMQSDVYSDFKYSPDAVYYENGVIVGGYETKSKAGKKHIEYTVAGVVPPEHLWQCLAPMIMDDSVKWWAFGHYDDRNHINPLFLTVIKRCDYVDFINDARALLSGFFADVDETVKRLGGKYNG
jgi:hypothetical protein